MDAVNKKIFLQLILLGVDFDCLPDTATSHVKGHQDLRFDYVIREEGGRCITIALSQCRHMPGGEVIASPIVEVRVWPQLQAAAVISKQEGLRCLEVQEYNGHVNVALQNRLNVYLMSWLHDCIELGYHFAQHPAEAAQG